MYKWREPLTFKSERTHHNCKCHHISLKCPSLNFWIKILEGRLPIFPSLHQPVADSLVFYSFLPRRLSCSVFMSTVCLSLAHSCSTHTHNLVSINLLNQSPDCRLRYYLFSGETERVEEKKGRLCTSSFQSVQWIRLWVYAVLLPWHKCKKGDTDQERGKRLEKGAKVWLSCQTTGRVQEIACFYLLRQKFKYFLGGCQEWEQVVQLMEDHWLKSQL